jgi:hypothetical protein
VGQRLELDETQKARLATLADTLREQRKQFMAGGRSPRDEINALIGGNAFDRAAAAALVERKLAAAHGGAPGGHRSRGRLLRQPAAAAAGAGARVREPRPPRGRRHHD